MPGSTSNFLELELLDHALGTGSFTMPATVALALFTAMSDTEAGTYTEVANAAGYARQTVVFNAAVSGSATGPTAEKTFTAAGGNWGTVTHIGLLTSATHNAGNLLFWAAIEAQTILDTESLVFPIDSIQVFLD